jgi:PKD repeat protein
MGIDSCRADFTAFVDSASNIVVFKGDVYGEPTDLMWDFGDGKTSSDMNTYNEYQNSGYYKVKFTIYDSLSGCINKVEKVVLVSSHINDCEADFMYVTETNNKNVIFGDNSLGNPDKWLWNFGDGMTSTLKDPIHYYYKGGVYNVCLNILNSNNGCKNISCKQVKVDINNYSNCNVQISYIQ